VTTTKQENWDDLQTYTIRKVQKKTIALAHLLQVMPAEIHVTEGVHQYKEQKYRVLTEKQAKKEKAKKVAPICYQFGTPVTEGQTTYFIYRIA
jgi:hypothetical protein